MRILLDENLPDSLVDRLRSLGHDVDSINRLDLKGIANGELYTSVAVEYDLCFTKRTPASPTTCAAWNPKAP